MSDMILWSPGITLEMIEKQVILKAYAHFRNNKTVTSNALGISIQTLDTKLEKYSAEHQLEEERKVNDVKRRQYELERARGNPPNNIGIPYNPSSHIGVPNVSKPVETVILNEKPKKKNN